MEVVKFNRLKFNFLNPNENGYRPGVEPDDYLDMRLDNHGQAGDSNQNEKVVYQASKSQVSV